MVASALIELIAASKSVIKDQGFRKSNAVYVTFTSYYSAIYLKPLLCKLSCRGGHLCEIFRIQISSLPNFESKSCHWFQRKRFENIVGNRGTLISSLQKWNILVQ